MVTVHVRTCMQLIAIIAMYYIIYTYRTELHVNWYADHNNNYYCLLVMSVMNCGDMVLLFVRQLEETKLGGADLRVLWAALHGHSPQFIL